MKTSSAKAKGRRLQQRIAADIVQAFGLSPDDATSRSTSAPGTDVLLSPAAQAVFPWAVEAKNVERLNVWQAFAQAEGNAKPGLAPLLVMSRNRCAEPLVVLTWSAFLKLQGR